MGEGATKELIDGRHTRLEGGRGCWLDVVHRYSLYLARAARDRRGEQAGLQQWEPRV